MHAFDLRLLNLAGRQHYVVTHDQLREFGSARQIVGRLAGRRARVGARIRVPGLGLTGDVAPAAARRVLRDLGRERALRSGRLHRCGRCPAARRSSRSPRRGTTARSTRDVRTHESFFPHRSRRDLYRLDSGDPTRTHHLRPRAAGEARRTVGRDALELAMQEAFRRDLLDVARVWREWERLGTNATTGRLVIEQLLTRFVAPVRKPDSTPEMRLLQLMRTAGLPEPVPQHRVRCQPRAGTSSTSRGLTRVLRVRLVQVARRRATCAQLADGSSWNATSGTAFR